MSASDPAAPAAQTPAVQTPAAQTSALAPASLGANHPATPATDLTTDLTDDLPRATLAAFIRTLAQWGNVRAAAQAVGVSRQHLYRMRRSCEEFRDLWDAALVLARPQVEEVLADRALNGVSESVFYHGEEVATRTRYDSRLLLAHLARLDRLERSGNAYDTARDFDARLERLLEPLPVYDWDDEDDSAAEGWDDADCAADWEDDGGD